MSDFQISRHRNEYIGFKLFSMQAKLHASNSVQLNNLKERQSFKLDFKIDALVEIQKICFSQSFNECMFWCFFFCSFNGYTE